MSISVSEVKISELSKMTDYSKAGISKFFKNSDDTEVTRVNNRIIGVTPLGVQNLFSHCGINYLSRPAVILSANLCGGVGKTTSIYNLGAATRRLLDKETPIVYIDSDSQASFTSMVFGAPAEDREPILIDYLDNKADLDSILTSLDSNTWFIKSNLNQAWIDKVLSKPQDIKNGMLRLYRDIFKKLGEKTKIFQDHAPQLSGVFASSISALHQLDNEVLKCLIIPLRSDIFAIQGGDYIMKEIEELQDTFNLEDSIDIHCFFSSIDRRISTTSEALKSARSKERILNHLSSVVVRYCSAIPKSIMAKTNVFSLGKSSNATTDYLDLLQSIFDKN